MKKHITSSLSKDKHFSQQQQQQALNTNFAENSNPSKTINYERRCQTPSILPQQHKKSKSKPGKQSKQRLSEKKTVYYSIKNFKPQPSTTQQYHSNIPQSSMNKQSKPSPFKHKHTKNKSNHVGSINFLTHGMINTQTKNNHTNNKTIISGVNNVRHTRNLQSQLSHLANLSDSSMFRHSQHQGHKDDDISVLIGGNNSAKKSTNKSKKHATSSQLQETISTKQHPLMNQGKSLMKLHNFTEAIKVFNQLLDNISTSKLHTHINISTQCHYLIGVCYFHLNQYENVVQWLTQVIVDDQQYRKNVYLFLGITYKKINMVEEALLVLSKALSIYPKYLDVLLLRAKILAKQKRFYDSIQDLNKCIKYDPYNIQAYISKADCLRNLSQFKQAISIYTNVLGKENPNLDILLKRAITFIQNDQISESLLDLNKILSIQPKNSQAYLFKGLAYTKQKNYNESILSYEQAIKFNTSKKAITKALYEISKLKIELGDYYGAAYTLERGQSLDIDLKVIEKLKIFVDGATFIMKKKYRRGIELLSILGKKQHLNEMIRSLLYSFRAYGNFCLNKYPSALNDLRQLIKCGFILDDASEYNMTLLEGIIKCQNNEFANAMQKFSKASEMRHDFGDPEMFQALCKISEYNRTPKLRQKNSHLLNEALSFILKAIDKQQNFNYHYLCALVMYILKDYPTALGHLEQAIQGSDVHVLKHFYLRAMINAMQEKYQECYTDLNNVLSISKELKDKEEGKKDGQNEDKTNHDANGQFEDLLNHQKEILEVYLNRAKCYLIFGEKKKAFQDLQTYIGQKPMDSSIHLIAGKLLFSIGACEDAIKAFNYSPNIDKNHEALLSRTKCYIYLKELNLSLRDMQKLLQMGDKLIEFDFYCLSALKQASRCEEENFKSAMQKITIGEGLSIKKGNIFTLSDLFFYKGVFYFMLEEYENAKKFMTKSKNIKKLNNELDKLPQLKDMNDSEYEQMFQNRIFTDKEVDYNIGLCELMLGNIKKAQEYLKEYEQFRSIFDVNGIKEKEDESSMNPFPTSNRLCSIFPEVEFQNKKKFRLSFDLPAVNPPPIVFETEYKLIEQVSMLSIQSRPDAPWIKRNQFGVVFTTSEELLKVEDVDIKTERSNDYDEEENKLKNSRQHNESLNLQYEQQHQGIIHHSKVKDKFYHQFIKISNNPQQNLTNIQKQTYLHKFEREFNEQNQNCQSDQLTDQYHVAINDKLSDQNRNFRKMFELDRSVEQRLNKFLGKLDN